MSSSKKLFEGKPLSPRDFAFYSGRQVSFPWRLSCCLLSYVLEFFFFLPLDIFELNLSARTRVKRPLKLTLESSGHMFFYVLTLSSVFLFFGQGKSWLTMLQRSRHSWLYISLQKVSVCALLLPSKQLISQIAF